MRYYTQSSVVSIKKKDTEDISAPAKHCRALSSDNYTCYMYIYIHICIYIYIYVYIIFVSKCLKKP